MLGGRVQTRRRILRCSALIIIYLTRNPARIYNSKVTRQPAAGAGPLSPTAGGQPSVRCWGNPRVGTVFLMEAQDDPKPKRKYVMTPEHRAKVMANLAQARLAPKEKVYRKTPKRYAGNLRNLGVANAKRLQEAEHLRGKMENLFPPPEAPPPPLEPLCPRPGRPPCRVPPSAGADEWELVTPLIAKRLRKVENARRREGRRLIRVLTVAMSRSQPLGAQEAFDLVCQILKCLEGSRAAVEIRRLNDRIANLLLKMIESRYGAAAQLGGVPYAHWLEQLRAEWRARAAERSTRRPPSPASKTEGATEPGKDAATGNSEGSQGQHIEPRQVNTLALPETEEEWRRVLARALALEGEAGAEVLEKVAHALWLRLEVWKRREEKERGELEELFREAATHPAQSYADLQRRRCLLNFALELDEPFFCRMDEAMKAAAEALHGWLEQRPMIRWRRQAEALGQTSRQPLPSSPLWGGVSGKRDEGPIDRGLSEETRSTSIGMGREGIAMGAATETVNGPGH